MPITSPLRICYLQHKLPEKTAKPTSVKWDPAEPDSVGIAFDDGTYLVWKYSNGLKKLYNLQQSAMPLPTFDSDKDINSSLPDAYGVTEPRAVPGPWLDFDFARVYDHRELFFAFNNSNKVHRTYLPAPSNVDMAGYISGSGVFEFAAHALPITAFTTSPLLEGEPPRLLTGSEDGTIILWDASVPCNDDLRDFGQRTIHIINAHEGSVIDVAFAGLEFYVSSGQDQAIRIWNISNGEAACYFHTEKVLVSKIQCGPISNKSYAIVAGSERGSIFMWKMDLPRKDDDQSDDDAIEDESTRILGSNDYISVRLVGMADHTETRINTISLFPIKSRYGENDGVGVACGNKEGGLIVYKYGRSSLLNVPSGIDANDENINFKNMPSRALELLHQAKYASSMLSNQARYELNLNRDFKSISSSEVVLLLSAASDGDVDVLRVPPAGHRTMMETLTSKNGEGDFSLLVTLNEPEEDEYEDVAAEQEQNRQQESPKRQSTISPQNSPVKQSTSSRSANMKFGEGFHTILSIEKSSRGGKKGEDEIPQDELPEPEPHPMITYNQVGLASGENLEEADDWAQKEFGDAIEPEKANISSTRKSAETPSKVKRVAAQKKKVFGPKIAKSFYNPERARALIEVEKNYRADYHAVEDGRDGIQKLGFHGGDPPYFSKTKFPVSELQEPVLQSSVALRNTIAKLKASKFDKHAAIQDTVVPVDPKNVNVAPSQMKYMGLIGVNAPTPVAKRTVRKQVSKKYLKERLNKKNKPGVFDAPGLKEFQRAESALKDKVNFYAPPEPKLFFSQLDGMTSSRGRFNMNSGY